MDPRFAVIPLVLPGRHFAGDQRRVVQPAVEALAVHDADLRLGHVHPTAVLGRVIEIDLVQPPARHFGTKRLVQARHIWLTQVALQHPDLHRRGVVDLDQFAHALRVVAAGAPLRHLDVPPAAQRLAHQQLMTDALALVLVVHPRHPAGPGRLRRPDLAEELLARLVEADHGVLRVVRQQVGLDYVLHPPDVVRVGLWRHAPGRDDPRLDVVFFSAWRTVSVLTDFASPSTTSSSASSCNVQWQRPSGGSLHASRINCCSTSPLILTLASRGGWGLGLRAAWRPSVTRRWRTRSTVRTPAPRAATMSASERSCPAAVSARRRMRACVSLRAAPLPTATNRSSIARSSASKVTRYLSTAGLLFLRPDIRLFLKKGMTAQPVNRRLTTH